MKSHPGLLRRLIHRSWQIVLLTSVASIALACLIFVMIQPTYEAFSLLRIEPSAPALYVPRTDRDNGTPKPYIQTQVRLIKSDQVLSAALANPLISNLPSVKASGDPKTDLRRKLSVTIVPDTYLIRVALDSKSPTEAAAIVNSVVDSYRAYTEQYAQSANRRLRQMLDLEELNLQKKIVSVHRELKELASNRPPADGKPQLSVNDTTAAILNHELSRLQTRQDQVTNYLAQLEFESNQESFRIMLVDPAAVPVTPSDSRRLGLIMAATVGVFFLILGLFLVLEIIAGRSARDAKLSSARLRAEARDLLEGECFPLKR